MNNAGVYVGLDIGTTAIKVVIAQVSGTQLNIIGSGHVPSRGMRRGVIVDIDETAAAIRQAIEQAQEKANVQITDVVVGIPANQLEILPVQGLVSVANQNKRITYDDVQNVAQQALSHSLPAEREIIDLVPEEFIVDGFDGIKDPHEMIGVRLEMRGTAYVGPTAIVANIRTAVQKAGLVVQQFVLTPLALANAILSEGERDFGTVIIDLGGGQTSVAVAHDHQLKFVYVDPEGGDNVTRDISSVLGMSYDNAEQVKRDYGYAEPSQTSEYDEFTYEGINGQTAKSNEEYLANIIAARLEQIFGKIKERLTLISALDMPGGFVLTGGNAALPRTKQLAQDYFGENVRLFIPEHIGLRHPAYTRAIAYAAYVSRQTMTQQVVKRALLQETQTANFDYEAAGYVPNQQVEQTAYPEAQYEQTQTNDRFFGKIGQRLRDLFTDETNE